MGNTDRLFRAMSMHKCGIRIKPFTTKETTHAAKEGSNKSKRHNMGTIYGEPFSD
jgi:hypothetical protein